MPEIKVLNNRELFPFIQGETIDLCIPNVDEDVIGEWSHWFNDPETTRYLNHGVFPNTTDD